MERAEGGVSAEKAKRIEKHIALAREMAIVRDFLLTERS